MSTATETPPVTTGGRDAPRWRRVAGIALLLAAAFALLLSKSLERRALNYGVETDFLGSFVPEARNFLEGRPLQLEYHPPLYPIALALLYRLTGDWLRSGQILSMVAAFAAALLCWALLRLQHGRLAAAGAVTGLIVSGTFLSFSLQASSDVFFLSLLLAALAALARATRTDRPFPWLLGGTLGGLAILTRTNGVAVLVFLLQAATTRGPRVGPLRAGALTLAGLALPLTSWLAFSAATGSPLLPRHTHENLALTYYAEGDRTSGDALEEASRGATSAWEVLTRDPRRVVRVYLRDLLANVESLFSTELLPFPLSHLAFPGLAVFLFLHLRRADWTLPLGLLAMFLLLNFKAWESRHYLCLVPFMGAGIAEGLAFLHAAARKAGATRGFVLACALSVALAAVELVRGLRRERSDLSIDSVSAAAALQGYGAPAGSVVLARKPHVCYYAGLECEGLPDAEGLEELRHAVAALLASRPSETKVFLFYGFVERELRPALAALHLRELELPWLRRIGTGKENRKWVLYEVVREALGAPGAG